MSNKHKTRWVLPAEKMEGVSNLVNGAEANSAMTGAYYGSSLEYNYVMTPQYTNAGDLLCPADEDIRRVFKPKRPYGTFGALVSDEDQNQYQYEADRCIVELDTVEEVTQVADYLDRVQSDKRIEDLGLVYRTVDGRTISYKEAIALYHSYKDFNNSIQQKIDKYIAECGLKPTFQNGKKVSVKYTDEQLSHIAALAREKKSITGFNIKLQLVGKHTIAKNGNYMVGSLNQEQLDSLAKKLNYRNKTSFCQGVIRAHTIVVPIQSLHQLKLVKSVVETMHDTICEGWPENVNKSQVRLYKERKV